MINETQPTNNWASGRILSIPLSIEDQHFGNLIKTSKLFLRFNEIRHGEEEAEWCIELTGACHEGIFDTSVDASKIQDMRSVNNSYSKDSWEAIVRGLMPSDGETSANNEFTMSSRLVSSHKNYDENTKALKEVAEDATEDHIFIDIKTTHRLPKILGSISLQLIDTDDSSASPDFDLFNWMGLAVDQCSRLNERVTSLQAAKDQTENDFQTLKDTYAKAQREHLNLVKDLQDKFYQVLNAKKDRIWELQAHSDKTLTDLNKEYHDMNILQQQANVKSSGEDVLPGRMREQSTKRRKVSNVYENQIPYNLTREIKSEHIGDFAPEFGTEAEKPPSDITSLEQPLESTSNKKSFRLSSTDTDCNHVESSIEDDSKQDNSTDFSESDLNSPTHEAGEPTTAKEGAQGELCLGSKSASSHPSPSHRNTEVFISNDNSSFKTIPNSQIDGELDTDYSTE